MSESLSPQSPDKEDYLWASGGSDPLSLAKAVSYSLNNSYEATVRAVGAGAVNQAVKAIAIARGRVASSGRDLICRPGFQTIPDRNAKDGEITAIVFRCSVR